MSKTILTLIIIFMIGFMTSGFWARNKVDSMPPLIKAAAHDDIVKMQTILEQGADPDTIGPMGVTAMVFAIRKKNLQAVKLLVEAQADLDAKPGGKSLNQIAEEVNASAIAEYLVNQQKLRSL